MSEKHLVYLGDPKKLPAIEEKLQAIDFYRDMNVPAFVFKYQPLTGKLIMVDPGHGGSDPGAVDPKDDDNLYTEEADLNLEYSIAFGERLADLGALVMYVRTDNTFIPIAERAKGANEEKVDLFISWYFNASGTNKVVSDMEVLAYKEGGEGYRLAAAIRDSAKAAGIPIFGTGISIRPDLGVLRLTNMPAVLIEGGFITTPAEEKQLRSMAHRSKTVEAAVNGVLAFYGKEV
jgi:N-acetylmuramoyl-L-alanine amidase